MFLHHFVLVFFDDILIYNKTWQTHVTHVDKVLQLLVDHWFFLNMSKCAFGVYEMEYLGYIVSHVGVHLNLKKIEAMKDWPCPKKILKA